MFSFTESYFDSVMRKYDNFILSHKFIYGEYGSIIVSIDIDEERYILEVLSNDTDITTIFEKEFLGMSIPIGTRVDFEINFISRSNTEYYTRICISF